MHQCSAMHSDCASSATPKADAQHVSDESRVLHEAHGKIHAGVANAATPFLSTCFVSRLSAGKRSGDAAVNGQSCPRGGRLVGRKEDHRVAHMAAGHPRLQQIALTVEILKA